MAPGRKRDAGDPGAGSGEPEGSFADAIGEADGIEPLPGRGDRVAEAPPRRTRADRRVPARFVFPDPDEPCLGYADGISDAQRRRLSRGQIPPERRIDLHGMRAEEARRHCLDGLCRAIEDGERCVLVVHGRGRHSRREPVLRNSLPHWLADPRLAGRVLAFAPATPGGGGPGATCVLLRRARGA